MIETATLISYVNELLQINRFRDYCPNGLQVEGRKTVSRIVSGVTASQALIDRAVNESADLLLVHHGYFWKNEDACITGMKRNRIARLLQHDINLAAYHLPLDAHNVFGNGAQLAKVLGITVTGNLTDDAELVFYGELPLPMNVNELSEHISNRLGREPFAIDARSQPIKTIAWCTGGAQGYIDHAVRANADAFITGEVSEQTYHVAMEMRIDFFAAGHHATERYGVQALGEHLAEKFGIEHIFIDVPNPV